MHLNLAIVFHDKEAVSPTVYLPADAIHFVEITKAYAMLQWLSPDQAAATFMGLVYPRFPLQITVASTPPEIAAALLGPESDERKETLCGYHKREFWAINVKNGNEQHFHGEYYAG